MPNAWAPWSLGIALVALIYGGVVAVVEINAVHVTDDRHALAPVPSGPVWLQGKFLSSWWEGAALLVIALAIAAGVRSLTLIGRGAEHGLGITVSGFLVSSAALVAGNAIVLGLLGVAASLVVCGRYAGFRRAGITAAIIVGSIGLVFAAVLLYLLLAAWAWASATSGS